MVADRSGDGVVERTASRLEARLLAGDVPPGTWLREERLSDELDVSRNSLRQALQTLERSGLVDRLPRRGVRVARPDADDVRDITRIRRMVESEAIRAAGPELGEELLSIAREIEDAADRGELGALVDADLLYHRAIVASMGSPRIDRLFEDLLRELRLAFALADRAAAARHEPPPHVGDHRRIAEAVAVGDRDAAVRLLALHLDDSESNLIEADPDPPA